MNTEDFKRKLTAILSTDVAGYSRLMGEDESATVKTLEAYKQVMFALIKQHRGRIIDSPGDNLLAEFASVVDAIQCGVAVQNELKTRNADLPETRRMQFRIGINMRDTTGILRNFGPEKAGSYQLNSEERRWTREEIYL